MTLNHLKFEELSDFIDNELSAERREYCILHIAECEICCREYSSLKKCITLLSSLNDEQVNIPDLTFRTLAVCRQREKKKLFLKAFPAIAASVIVIAGSGFIKTGFFSNSGGAYIAANITGHNETQRIIESIGVSKGKILQITHSYIDTEFDRKSLESIEKMLHKNGIKHAVIVNTGMLVNPSSGNIEDVGYTTGGSGKGDYNYSKIQNYATIDNGKVRLRIFK